MCHIKLLNVAKACRKGIPEKAIANKLSYHLAIAALNFNLTIICIHIHVVQLINTYLLVCCVSSLAAQQLSSMSMRRRNKDVSCLEIVPMFSSTIE